MPTYLKDNEKWLQTAVIYVKVNDAWVKYTVEQFSGYTSGRTFTYGGFIDNDHTLTIIGVASITGESYTFAVLYDRTVIPVTACTWQVIDGQEYATMEEPGTIAISTGANNSNVTVSAELSGITAERPIVVSHGNGTTGETETEIVVDESGNTTVIITTTVVNEDGSSNMNETTVVTDESGNTLESTETNVDSNADGSYTGTSVTYDGDGNPTYGENVTGDTEGNVNTQDVRYDESGNSAVTSYTIDTSGNPDGEKTYNADGVNTEYYAFDLTEGFVLDFNFTIDFSNQPAGQDENHHNILTMKRATPSPWYGFQLRQSSTNKNIILGTQFSGGSNTNTTITPMSLTGNVGEYNIKISFR